MALHFNTLLRQEGIELSSVRLLRHQDGRATKGRTPYRLWRENRPAFELYQSIQSPENRAKLKGEYWASFIADPFGATLLAGVYRCRYLGRNQSDQPWPHADGVDLAGTCDLYELILDDRFQDFAGKLIIDWGGGSSGKRAWIQRADNQDEIVRELRATFSELPFPGFSAFSEPLSRVEKMPRDWISVLKAAKGVYLLTCPRTHEHYVGSATGEDGGFFGRWIEYARDGHGGNLCLKNREPSDYQVAILEVAGSNATLDEILRMEYAWMKKLRSRLNRNGPTVPRMLGG